MEDLHPPGPPETTDPFGGAPVVSFTLAGMALLSRRQWLAGAAGAVMGPAGAAASREVRITGRYLHFPVAPADKDRVKVRLLLGGEAVRYFDIDFAEPGAPPLYWASVDVAQWKGQTLRLECEDPALAGLVQQDDTLRQPDNLYHEPRRPQFHFTPRTGWTNDPNGLAWLDGEYHLFFQHNPYGVNWGNMTWGHAVSPDLVHWTELGEALHPDALGTIFSGSAVVDHDNTSALGSGGVPPLVAFYTSAGNPYTQSMAYSTDRGRTWTKYAGNPIIGHIAARNRDPKVFRHEPSGRWVMVLYLDRGKFRLLESGNLKEWSELSDIDFPDGHECPELFELAVDGDPANTRWVMWEGGGRHLIGRFDGRRFTPETEVLPSEWGANCYAAQTWNHVPDGRRILIGWMRHRPKEGEPFAYQGMPFNQQMTFPRLLSLRTTPEGIRLFAEPVAEIGKLRARRHGFEPGPLRPGDNPLAGLEGELWDLELEVDPGKARAIELGIRGMRLTYACRTGELAFLGKSVKLDGVSAGLKLRVLVDRTSVEIFAAGGRYVMSFCVSPEPDDQTLSLAASGGESRIASMAAAALRSVWP